MVACWLCLPPLGSCDADTSFLDFGLAVVVGCVDFDGDWLGCADCFCGVFDGLAVVVGAGLGAAVVAGAGAGAGGGGGVATVGVTCCTTAPRSWTLTTGIATPATVIVLGALPGSPVHGTLVPLASFRRKWCGSADAGSTAPPKPARKSPAATKPMTSLRFMVRSNSPRTGSVHPARHRGAP